MQRPNRRALHAPRTHISRSAVTAASLSDLELLFRPQPSRTSTSSSLLHPGPCQATSSPSVVGRPSRRQPVVGGKGLATNELPGTYLVHLLFSRLPMVPTPYPFACTPNCHPRVLGLFTTPSTSCFRATYVTCSSHGETYAQQWSLIGWTVDG